MSQFLNLGLETEILVLSRARFVKKPVPGSELHGVRGCASLYRGMGLVRKPVPGINPGSKSSPAYHNLLPWSLAITNLQQTPLLKLCADSGVAGQGGPGVRTPPTSARWTHGIGANPRSFFWGDRGTPYIGCLTCLKHFACLYLS